MFLMKKSSQNQVGLFLLFNINCLLYCFSNNFMGYQFLSGLVNTLNVKTAFLVELLLRTVVNKAIRNSQSDNFNTKSIIIQPFQNSATKTSRSTSILNGYDGFKGCPISWSRYSSSGLTKRMS